jgi:starvation-inducible DNA-binding protein
MIPSAATLNTLLADVFTLCVKTKNFEWHMSGPHFRDYYVLLEEPADQIFATTDAIAERVRKIGGPTLRSVQHVARLARLAGHDADFVAP